MKVKIIINFYCKLKVNIVILLRLSLWGDIYCSNWIVIIIFSYNYFKHCFILVVYNKDIIVSLSCI